MSIYYTKMLERSSNILLIQKIFKIIILLSVHLRRPTDAIHSRVSFTTKDYRGTTCRQLSSLLLLTTPIFPSGLAAYVLAKNEAESCYVVA